MTSGYTGEPDSSGQRVYGGLTGDERRSRRRTALLDAAFDLIGSRGYHAATVRAVCRESGLSERYFYENFDSRDALFSAVYEAVIHSARDAVVEAIAALEPGASAEQFIGRGVESFIRHVTADERRVSVILVDLPGITTDRNVLVVESTTSFSQLIEQAFVEVYRVEPPELRHLATGLVGLLSRLLSHWRFQGSDPAEIEPIIETCRVCFTVSAATFAGRSRASGPTVDEPGRIAEALDRSANRRA